MKNVRVGDRVEIVKDGTSTLLPPDTGYPEKLLLEDAGRTGTVIGLVASERGVVRVRWDPGSYRIFGDFVLGSSGRLETTDRGRVEMPSMESHIHSDFLRVVDRAGPEPGSVDEAPTPLRDVEARLREVALTVGPLPVTSALTHPSGALHYLGREAAGTRPGMTLRRLWRAVVGLRLADRKRCFHEMREYMVASMPAVTAMDASMRAILRAARKWDIPARRARRIFDEGRQRHWE